VRALVSIVLTAVAVVIQLTIVDRIAFPGGGGPNLVLLLVAALALAGGPMAGVLTGFFAGLALDVAPPGSHFIGQSALVFCLIGYVCGLLSDDFSGDAEQGHTALFEIVVTAAGAVCGEALAALLGVMLSDPRVSWPAITHVLPVAVAYDILLCPFVLYAAAASLRLAGVRREDHRPGFSASQVRSQLPATSQGAIRQLAGGAAPRLRLSERDRGVLGASAGSLRGPGASRAGSRPGARREPQLKLAARPPGPARPSPPAGWRRARPGSNSAVGAGRACSAAPSWAAPA
jgi:rod shape-determining protein MreD